MLELPYTSWHLKPYAVDLGDDGPPFRWDPERNRDLWRVERYSDFLAARRELLAASAQSFLEGLRNPDSSHDAVALERLQVAEEDIDDPRDEQVRALIAELNRRGYAEPEVDAEIPDPDTGRACGG